MRGYSSNDVLGRTTVYFIGSSLGFPDALIKILDNEFPEIEFVQTSNFRSVEEPTLFSRQTPLAVVVEDSKFAELEDTIQRYRREHGPFTVALAYRDPCTARKFLKKYEHQDGFGDLRFLPMNIQFDRWLSVFRLVLSGEGYLPYELLDPAFDGARQDIADGAHMDGALHPGVDITTRERQVLKLLAEGKQNKIIAKDLNLSIHTVKLHIHHLINKLGVTNRTEAAMRYAEIIRQPEERSS